MANASASPGSPIGTSAIGRLGGGGSAISSAKPLDPGRPTDAGHRGAAHQLD